MKEPFKPEFPFDFSNLVSKQKPYEHCFANVALNKEFGNTILQWFESDAPWQYSENHFYQTHKLRLINNPNISPIAHPLVSLNMLSQLARNFSPMADMQLSETNFEVFALKVVPGFKMGIHTDFGPEKQVFRLQFYLNNQDNWSFEENGGLLMMFDTDKPDMPSMNHQYYLPENYSMVGFKITPYTFHAISPVVKGNRYTIVYSFYAA